MKKEKRNFCDMCKNCKDNEQPILYCVGVCVAPMGVLRVYEKMRNDAEKMKDYEVKR